VTFSISGVPQALLNALPEGAKLLAPVGPAPPNPQRYLLYTRESGELKQRDLGIPVVFIPRRALADR
jgi:protein-L-isoaspartate O-methyltransferase